MHPRASGQVKRQRLLRGTPSLGRRGPAASGGENGLLDIDQPAPRLPPPQSAGPVGRSRKRRFPAITPPPQQAQAQQAQSTQAARAKGGSLLTRKIKKHKQKVRQTRKSKLKPKPHIMPKQQKTKKIQTHKPKYLSATPKIRSILRKKNHAL